MKELLTQLMSLLVGNEMVRSAVSAPTTTGCQGINGTTSIQCQRLYGGTQYTAIPVCISSSELPLVQCLNQLGPDVLNIVPCSSSVFGSEYPRDYLQCITDHSGVSYLKECNICSCMCNGLSRCTKKGCIGHKSIEEPTSILALA